MLASLQKVGMLLINNRMVVFPGCTVLHRQTYILAILEYKVYLLREATIWSAVRMRKAKVAGSGNVVILIV